MILDPDGEGHHILSSSTMEETQMRSDQKREGESIGHRSILWYQSGHRAGWGSRCIGELALELEGAGVVSFSNEDDTSR
jgi:hypothetical protein